MLRLPSGEGSSLDNERRDKLGVRAGHFYTRNEMSGIDFIQDLGLVMLIAAVAAWICQRIGLPLAGRTDRSPTGVIS